MLALTSQVLGNLQDLEEKTNSMMEKTSTISPSGKPLLRSRCKVCGKEGSHANDLRKHIEAKHLEGVSLPCDICGKTFRCRISLLLHKCVGRRGGGSDHYMICVFLDPKDWCRTLPNWTLKTACKKLAIFNNFAHFFLGPTGSRTKLTIPSI